MTAAAHVVLEAAALFQQLFARAAWLRVPPGQHYFLWLPGVLAAHQVVFTPGSKSHPAQPGYFRVCFGQVPQAALVEAVRRLALLLGA